MLECISVWIPSNAFSSPDSGSGQRKKSKARRAFYIHRWAFEIFLQQFFTFYFTVDASKTGWGEVAIDVVYENK